MADQAKHTPGPWLVHERPYDGVDFVIEFGPGDWGGFQVCNHGGIDRRTGEWTDPMADARLIAAAPLMLEALEAVPEDDRTAVMRVAIAAAKGCQP